MASFPNSRLPRMMVYKNFNASFLLHKISTLNRKHRAGLPNWKILDQTKELTVGEFNDLDSEQLSAGSTSYVLSLADGFQINVDSYNVGKAQVLVERIQAHNKSQSQTGKIIYIKYLVHLHSRIGVKFSRFYKKVILADDYQELCVIFIDSSNQNAYNSGQQYIIKREHSSQVFETSSLLHFNRLPPLPEFSIARLKIQKSKKELNCLVKFLKNQTKLTTVDIEIVNDEIFDDCAPLANMLFYCSVLRCLQKISLKR